MANFGTGDANQTGIVIGQEGGGIVAGTETGGIGQEGETQAIGETIGVGEESAIEVRDFGIQAGDLDEYAEYFECFLKIGDCLPKIIVCGNDDEMPRIVVCEGLKRKPPVNTTDETKKILLEIQKQVAEMINAVQINAILREEINHIEGECPVIKLKEVMKRINAVSEPCEATPPTLCSCKKAMNSSCSRRYSSNSDIHHKSFRSSHSYEQSRSKQSITDTIQVTCSMCLKRTQPVTAGCCCKHSSDSDNTYQQLSVANMSQCLSRGSDIFSDDDIKALIDKCLGPPCKFCEADKYDSIVDDLDMQANMFSKTGQKIYDVIVPPGYKDQQGWGGNHKIERSVLASAQVPCNAQKYVETVEELKGELSKLDHLGDMLFSGDNTFNNRPGNIECESASCINAASYLNNQIAQIEEELNTLRMCLDRSRKERAVLETQQNIYSCLKPLCYN